MSTVLVAVSKLIERTVVSGTAPPAVESSTASGVTVRPHAAASPGRSAREPGRNTATGAATSDAMPFGGLQHAVEIDRERVLGEDLVGAGIVHGLEALERHDEQVARGVDLVDDALADLQPFAPGRVREEPAAEVDLAVRRLGSGT